MRNTIRQPILILAVCAPRRTYQRSARRYCREYILKAQVGNRYQQVYGAACRQPDGSCQVRS
ncbi:MAG TPA: hypothetical protein ENI62_01385 [Gammaproteobacteria bacterium]|nr:hypothetical protein [Gammaproteobacteria bacterium]